MVRGDYNGDIFRFYAIRVNIEYMNIRGMTLGNKLDSFCRFIGCKV